MQRIAFVAIENVAVFMVLYYFAYRNFFSRLILVYIFLLTFLFVYFWHRLFRWILAKNAEREVGIYRTLIIGANRPAEDIIKHLLKTKSHIKPVAIIDAHGSGKSVIAGVPVVGKMNMFEKAIAQHEIDHMNGIMICDNEIKSNEAHSAKISGRNDPCPCGSGKKFKKCCI